MSKYAKLGIGVVVIVLALVGTDVLITRIAGDRAAFWFSASARLTVYALAAITAGLAASMFGWWREEIGRPWILLSSEFAFLFINYAIRRTAPDARLALSTTVILANICQVAAFWLLSRTLQSAGIGHLVDSRRRVAMTAIAFLVAIAIEQSSLIALWHTFQSGTMTPASFIVLAADIVTFTLVAPLAMSMVTLRGGQVFWIFAFLTVSVLGWMFNSAADAIVGYMGGGDVALRSTRMAGVAIAALFSAAAAATQWLSARRTMNAVAVNV